MGRRFLAARRQPGTGQQVRSQLNATAGKKDSNVAGTNGSQLVQFTSSPGLAQWLLDRADLFRAAPSAGLQAKTELMLWRDLLAAETARQRWTLPELAALAGVRNQRSWPAWVHVYAAGVPAGVGFAAGVMLESFQLDPGRYTGFDQAAFTAKLLALGPVADHALVTAIARWLDGKHEHDADGWAAVGIQVTDPPTNN